MTKKWQQVKRSASKWAVSVGTVVSKTASFFLRRNQSRQVGRLEEEVAVPDHNLNNNFSTNDGYRHAWPDNSVSTEEQFSFDLSSSVLDEDDFSSVLTLPYDCRALIYEYVRFADVLNLRLACKQMYYELNYCRGLRVKLDDTMRGYDWFRDTGVGALVVRHFCSEDQEGDGILMRPQLLRELTISGNISQEKFNWLIAACPNIKKFAVELSPYTVRNGLQSFSVDTKMPPNLTTLRLSAFMYDHNDAQHTGDIIFPILRNTCCPATLSTFVFQLVIIDSQSLDDFHIEALKFIRRHAHSLRTLHVQIKQVYVNSLPATESNDDPELQVSKWVHRTNLKELRFTLDRHLNKWIPLVNSQAYLASLVLNLRNLRWNFLSTVIQKCRSTLKNIQVYNVNVKQGHRICPVDLGVLRNCHLLQKLTLHHTEHPPTYCAKISRTACLPLSLTEIDVSRILVKQHQLLYILIRMPNLSRLEVAYWSDTDSYFASSLSLLPLLIKFNITPLKSVTMTDLRRRFDNHKTEVHRLRNFLGRLATVKVSDSVRESRLSVDVHSLDDERNFSACTYEI